MAHEKRRPAGNRDGAAADSIGKIDAVDDSPNDITTSSILTAGGAQPLAGLGHLAEQINAAHGQAHVAARTAIEHAIECGRLLLEAKAQVAHGEWLPWVEAHLSFGDRQARKYMRVAANAEQLTNRNCGSDVGINAALELLAAPKDEPRSDHEPGSWDWCDAQLKGPFSAWDVTESNVDWLTTKLLHHAKLPPVANVCLQAQGEHGFPILRLVPADELYAAIEALAPSARGEHVPPFDHASLNPYGVYRLWQALKVMAERGLGQLIAEFNYRDTLDDEQDSREFDAIKARWLGRLGLALQGLAAGAQS